VWCSADLQVRLSGEPEGSQYLHVKCAVKACTTRRDRNEEITI
jgi:hypothetical protein